MICLRRNITGCTQRRFSPKSIENTFYAMQSTFRSLATNSKWRYKICICSAILGKLESFRNYKFLETRDFRCNFKFYESENFSDSSLHHIFNLKIIFRFPFPTKNRLTWVLKCEKLNFKKS